MLLDPDMQPERIRFHSVGKPGATLLVGSNKI